MTKVNIYAGMTKLVWPNIYLGSIFPHKISLPAKFGFIILTKVKAQSGASVTTSTIIQVLQ